MKVTLALIQLFYSCILQFCLEAARTAVEAELRELKSSSTTSTSEAETLHSRISTLESANRDTLALLESKSTAHDRLAEELAAQHQKIVALRREVSELEAKNQSSENASTSAKYREQSLQQEVDLLKRNNEWHENELKTRSAEQTKFRKEKNARIAELQRTNEDATQTIESLKRTENQLRSRLEELNGKFEESLQRVQQLQEAASQAEESSRSQLESTRRLAELQKQSADTARNRLQEVNENMDRLRDRAAEEIGELQAEVQTERSERETTEQRVAELESHVEKLQGDLAAAQQAPQIPGTPRRNGVANVGTPGRAGSPAFSPGSSRMKGGLSVTQLYTENSQMKADLQRERNTNDDLRRNLDDMIQMIENKGPEIEEMKMERNHLQAENEDMASFLQQVTNERDAARKDSRKLGGQLEGLSREANLLRQQTRDLSAQIKVLLFGIQAREEGLGALSAAEQMQLEQAARDGLDEATMASLSDTGQWISQHLVVFKNVTELQEQNSRLLLLTREIGEKLEGEEAQAKQQQQEKDAEELENLRERVQRHQDEMKALATRAESYIRERDMFRRMLSHRGQLPRDAEAVFAQSVEGSLAAGTPTPLFGQSTDDQSLAKNLSDAIKELQSRFDNYKDESLTDNNTLREQNRSLAKEKSDLQSDISKFSSQLEMSRERYDLLKSNYEMLKNENGELQRRSQAASETAAKQDLRTQQVAEELVQANSLAESLRNEAANLKAERELWKKIETRLEEDHRSLMDERSRLNKMITDLQNLQNERELSDSETRRRLQGRVESLESELATSKRKLEDELDDNRKATLRREYEQEQNRTRIDDLMKSLSNTREELVAAKTKRDELQARVEEMKIELRSAEEKAQALQPRPTPRPGITTTQDASAQDDTATLTREQDLQLEVAQLKRDLDMARQELEQAKTHVEQYKAIAQSSEEELGSLNDTNDQYREETDRLISEKDSKLEDLEKRVEEISSELTTTSQELTMLRAQQEDENSKLNEQKSIYDAEIVRLNDEVERYKETANLHQEDKKAQAEIAQQAQQNYENELVKHAEAARTLQVVRTEYNQLRTEVASIRADAEAAKTTLSQSQESWTETRGQYEREISELRTRRDDVNQQNKLLHQQLDNVSSQISALKQNRASMGGEEEESGSASSGLENLQEVIRYLRREKEIVDVQYELSIQEAKRLQQQLQYAQNQLDQEREKLTQERQKADGGRGVMSHNELMENINKLNLFRESNATLRNEAEQARAQLTEKDRQVDSLTSQLQPIQTRVRELENELETKEGEIAILQKDRDHYQTRVQNILQKYNRIDPEELEALKNQVSTLQTERDQLQEEKQPLQETIDGFEAQLQAAVAEARNDMKERLSKQFKERSAQQSARIREKDAEIQSLTEKQQQLTQELETTKAELEQVKAARDEAVSSASASKDVAMQNGVPEDEGIGFSAEEKAALEARATTAEAKAKEETDKAAGLQIRVQELESQVKDVQQRLDSTSSELSTLKASASAAPEPVAQGSTSAEEIEQLKAALATAQRELDDVRATAAIAKATGSSESNASNPTAEQVAEQVATIRAELDAKFDERVKEKDEQLQRRSNNLKDQLNTKLREVRKEKEDTIAALKEEHRLAMEQVQNNKAAAPTTTENATADPSTESTAEPAAEQPATPVKAEGVASLANLSEKEIKDFIAGNATVKGIMFRNIQAKVEKSKADQEKLMEEKLAEAQVKADQAKQQAVTMETSRNKVMLTMAQNREKNAQAKIDFVETAAKETPTKPVSEVWEIAKTMKAAPAQSPAQGAQPGATQQIKTASMQAAKPAPATAASKQEPGQPAISTTQQPNVQSSPAPPQAQSSPTPVANQQRRQSQAIPTAATNQGASAAPTATAPAIANTAQVVPAQQAQQQTGAASQGQGRQSGQFGTGPAALAGIVNQASRGGSRIPSSGLPTRGGSIRGGRGGQQGGQQQASQAQSGIPAPGTSVPRGGQQSGIPGPGRGRGQNQGQGRGRGAGQQNLNPVAQQFVPGGNKRSHDGDDDGAGRGGKRPRGGQQGGGN